MFKRILMNAADASPGNGAPASPPADVPPSTTSEPKANGTSTTVSPDDFTKLVNTVGELSKSVNSLHAADRRAREGKQPPADPATPKPPPTADETLAIRDAFDDATSELKLTKGQRQLLREHVMSKRPSPADVDSMVSDYVGKAGWGATTAPATPTAAPAAPAPAPQPATAIPVTDRGSPPPSTLPLEERKLQEMSQADRDEYIKRHGLAKYNAKLLKDLQGVPVR